MPTTDETRWPELVSHLESLDDRRDSMIQLVEQLCNINSGTLNVEGVGKVEQVLASEYRALGAELTIHSVPPVESISDLGEPVVETLGNLIHVVKRPERRPRILMCIHMDTVYDTTHPFQKCHWIDKHTLGGPGVADAKGGLVVMLEAIRALESSPLAEQIGWEVIINPDEEIGSPGSNEFLQARAHEADFGLLFEPSLPDGTLVSWRKGSGNFDFVVRGRSAHSGREFEKGRNAIVALSRLMLDIDGLNTHPDVTLNVGKVIGGQALNMVPDLAVGRVNVRVKTEEQRIEIEKQFSRLVNKHQACDGIDVECHGLFRSAPKTIDTGTAALQQRIEHCGQALEIPISWRGTGGACDGNKFASVGLSCIDTLGPQGGNIHSSNEFLLVDSLVPRAKLTALVLLSFAAEMAV